MKKSFLLIALVLVAALSLLGQKAPAFEVATIRPAEPITPQMIQAGKLQVGQRIDGARVEYRYLSLRELIPIAYEVKPYQMTGPDWLIQQRFDIAATLPQGTTKEQVPAMLKALLVERFHLKVHKESKDQNVYALVQAKEGHKLKSAVEEAVPSRENQQGAANEQTGQAGAKKPDIGMTINGQQVAVNRTADGATMSTPDTGTVKISQGSNGGIRMEMARITIPKLIEQFGPMVDRPVIDQTGLEGAYQVTLEISMQDIASVARMAGIGLPGGGAGGGAATAGPAATTALDPGTSSLYASIQQMGLRLDGRKAPIDNIVVDSVDKSPTEN